VPVLCAGCCVNLESRMGHPKGRSILSAGGGSRAPFFCAMYKKRRQKNRQKKVNGMHNRCRGRKRSSFGELPPSATTTFTAAPVMTEISNTAKPVADPVVRSFSYPLGLYRSHDATSIRATGF